MLDDAPHRLGLQGAKVVIAPVLANDPSKLFHSIGSALRKVVVEKTRHALESALASIKQTVEQQRPAAR